MPLSHCFIRIFLAICVLCCIADKSDAQPGSSNSLPAGASSRMRVLESKPQPTETFLYTIVGAVKESGVYRTSARSIPLRRLLDGAGGLSDQAQYAARVIRNGEIRFQIPVHQQQSATEEWLLPGDIVVIPGTPSVDQRLKQPYVPVVCIGLVNHPVVLPLDPTITTVQQLTKRLGQSPQLAQATRLIDPMRGHQSSGLMTGSVVFFDYRMVDNTPFSPGFLPDVIDLDPARTSAIPGPVPAFVEMPPDVPPSTSIIPASGDQMIPQIIPQPAPAASLTATQPLTVPPLQLSASKPTTPAEPTTQQAESVRENSQLPLSPDLAHALELFAPKPAIETSDSKAAPAETPAVKSAPPAASRVHTAEAQHAGEESAPADAVTQTGGLVTSLPPLPKEGTPAILKSDGSATNLSIRTGKSLSAQISASKHPWLKVLEYLLYGGGALSVLVGCSLLISVATNTHRAVVALNSQLSAATAAFTPPAPVVTPEMTQAAKVEPVPAAPVAPIVSGSTTCESPNLLDAQPGQEQTAPPIPERVELSAVQPIQTLLNRSIPLVEEKVEVPGSWPLHGKVIGHRRCILNASHEEIAGPHFGQRQKSPDRQKIPAGKAVASERLLRSHLREIFRSEQYLDPCELPLEDVNDCDMRSEVIPPAPGSPLPAMEIGNHSGADFPLPPFPPDQTSSSARSVDSPAASLQATAAGPDEFDIVMPQTFPNEPKSAMSPLERALRILAVEKHG